MWSPSAELPPEILLDIFSHLSPVDMCHARQVCRNWSDCISPPTPPEIQVPENIWAEFCPPPRSGDDDAVAWYWRAKRYFPEFLPLIPPGHSVAWLCVVWENRRNCQQGQYVGEVVDDVLNGWGIFRSHPTPAHPLGRVHYVGQWKDGTQHGWGTFTWPRECARYRGFIQRGERHGFGEYEWDAERRYVGQHKHDQLNGHGIYTHQKAVVDGEWKRNRQHGKSTVIWPPEAPTWKFMGHFVDGNRVGQGTYYWADGAVYDGHWDGVNRHGQGKMKYANGLIYEGTFEHDLRHGAGTLIWPDGSIFRGHWYRGGRRGHGVLTFDQVMEEEQEWNEPEETVYSDQIPAQRRGP
jgi:hypothetical protein